MRQTTPLMRKSPLRHGQLDGQSPARDFSQRELRRGERARSGLRSRSLRGELPLWFCSLIFLVCCEERFEPASAGEPIIPSLPPRTDRSIPTEREPGSADLEVDDAELPLDIGPARDAATFAPVPFAVETRVGERNTPAGLENRITCQVLD